MSSMSRSTSSSLMGFSVSQPFVGAPLQFVPAMGSEELDKMIDAYIPGDAPILDKTAIISVEFFQYTLSTGESYKFFMVYPTAGSTGTSPTVVSSHSGFTTSPSTSESQRTSPSSQTMSCRSSSKRATSNDLSNLPGMKIMTKDGRDVTNSASRGCKTKEQRDHAHLMRKLKACDTCKRKKTKCDPSHKRSLTGVSSAKVTKRTSTRPHPPTAPAQQHIPDSFELEQMVNLPSSLDTPQLVRIVQYAPRRPVSNGAGDYIAWTPFSSCNSDRVRTQIENCWTDHGLMVGFCRY